MPEFIKRNTRADLGSLIFCRPGTKYAQETTGRDTVSEEILRECLRVAVVARPLKMSLTKAGKKSGRQMFRIPNPHHFQMNRLGKIRYTQIVLAARASLGAA